MMPVVILSFKFSFIFYVFIILKYNKHIHNSLIFIKKSASDKNQHSQAFIYITLHVHSDNGNFQVKVYFEENHFDKKCFRVEVRLDRNFKVYQINEQ